MAKLGYPVEAHAYIGYEWTPRGPGIMGDIQVTFEDNLLDIKSEFGASFLEWHANVCIPEFMFSDNDPIIKGILAQHPITAVSNLTFSGSISVDASVQRTPSMPVPVWDSKIKIRNTHVSMVSEDKPISIYGLSLTPIVSGIANHIDINPLFIKADSLMAANFSLTNAFAAIHANTNMIMVTEASAGFCGGKVSLYSLFLDPSTLNTGFTLFIDNLDAGKAMSLYPGFSGEASGLLHGKTRLFIREGGKSISIRDAFLYSTPGETGKIKVTDSSSLTEQLELAGIAESERENVANVLTDVDYSVLKIDLKRIGKDSVALGFKIEGSATRGKHTVPVVLDITLKGDIEQLINTSLMISNNRKGADK